jgi:hypothetical protein
LEKVFGDLHPLDWRIRVATRWHGIFKKSFAMDRHEIAIPLESVFEEISIKRNDEFQC